MAVQHSPIRTALVGLRHAHINYVIQHAQQKGDLQIVAVADDDAALRERFAEQLGVPGFATLEELLDRVVVDAVALTPINSEKAPIIVQALMAGLHVIVDKPLLVSWEQFESVQAAVQKTGRILSLMLTLRFNPVYTTAYRLVQEGAIGRLIHAWFTRPHKLNRPKRPDWMFRRASYGGIIPDLCIHDIDYFRWLLNAPSKDEIEHLFALHGNYGISGEEDFEDAGHVLLRLHGGTVGSFEANWYTPEAAPYHGDCRGVLTGERGTIEIDTVGNRVILSTHTAAPHEVPLDKSISVVDDFVAGIRYGPEAMVLPPDEALESTAWTLMARDLADQHGTVRRPVFERR